MIIIDGIENFKNFCGGFHTEKTGGRVSSSLYRRYLPSKVDKQTGPYRSIQEAIDAAMPNSLIKITEGFYEENLYIKYW